MKPILASVALVLGFAASAAAQDPPQFAYDTCWANPDWYEIDCAIGTYPGAGTSAHSGYAPRWSPDGTKLVYYEPNYGYIAVLSVDTGTETVITDMNANWNQDPVWTPDGRIVFVSYRDGLAELYAMDGDGSDVTRLTNHLGVIGYRYSWSLSPDGTRLVFAARPASDYGLWIMNMDGTGLRLLTTQFERWPSWSADGQRLVFECASPLRPDICVMNADGTGFQKLTSDPTNDINDTEPAFSPADGTIAFTTEMFGAGPEIALMDAAGVVTRLAPGVGGGHAVWSPDGARLLFTGTTPSYNTGICTGDPDYDFCVPVYPIYVINADGSGLTAVTDGENPDWRSASAQPQKPGATFTGQCSGTACTFDATASTGSIVSYSWQFGDGASGAGATASHTYSTGATYSVTLTVVGPGGSDSATKSFVANTPPVASFTQACTELTCTFNASASSDVDGAIVAYAWSFGDGQTAAGATVTHTYAAPGQTYVSLTVTDSGGAKATTSHAIQVTASMHIGDLDRWTSTYQSSWSAFVTVEVHNAAHQTLLYATVAGVWSDGTVDSCDTSAVGRCTFARQSLPKKTASLTFTVQKVTRSAYAYAPAANHDPDGDSNGTTIVVAR